MFTITLSLILRCFVLLLFFALFVYYHVVVCHFIGLPLRHITYHYIYVIALILLQALLPLSW